MNVKIGVIGSARLGADGELAGSARRAAFIQARGAETAVAGLVGADASGALIRAKLAAAGVDVRHLATVAEGSTGVGDGQGVEIALGQRIDIPALFGMNAMLIDVSDFRLHRFLVDLPVHTSPDVRLIGLIGNLASNPNAEAYEIVLAHDLVIATGAELVAITGTSSEAEALDAIQARMTGKNLRATAAIDSGGVAHLLTRSERWSAATNLNFDRFVAEISIAFAERRPWSEALLGGKGA